MTKLILAALLVGALAVPLSAGPVAAGTWYEFAFGAAGVPATGCLSCVPSSGTPTVYADTPPWTFASTLPALLTVTDAFLYGDAFDVFDFGGLIGATPAVGAPGGGCGDDPALCLADPLSSHAVFILAAGAHSITITPNVSPWGGGAAYFKWDAVPEPGTYALFGLGLAVLAALRARARKA